MPRVLDNWITAFRDWTIPRSEAQESLILWSGLWTIAAAMKRRVCFPRSILGSYDIYPNLYIMFVGPPGIVRKSTTAGYAQELLSSTELAHIGSTAMSTSKMINIMSNNSDGGMAIISSEFGSFANISKDEMYDALTDIYDNPNEFTHSTHTHGDVIIDRPSLNMLGCTTPEWVSNYMPVSAIGGGFASRVIFIYENTVRQRRLYYDIDQRKIDDLGEALKKDLIYISELEGEFRHDKPETKAAMEEWYKKSSEIPSSDPRITHYLQRKHTHVHKVAMILSLAEGDSLVINQTHFEAAKALLEQLEINMPRVFSGVGRNPYSADLEGILDFIASIGDWVDKQKIVRRFSHNLTVPQIDEILSTLVVSGFLRVGKTDEAKGRAFRIKD